MDMFMGEMEHGCVFFSACLTLQNLWICCYMRVLAPYPMTQVLPNLHRFAIVCFIWVHNINRTVPEHRTFQLFSVQRIFFRCGSDRPKSVTPKDLDFRWFQDSTVLRVFEGAFAFVGFVETRPMCSCCFSICLLQTNSVCQDCLFFSLLFVHSSFVSMIFRSIGCWTNHVGISSCCVIDLSMKQRKQE